MNVLILPYTIENKNDVFNTIDKRSDEEPKRIGPTEVQDRTKTIRIPIIIKNLNSFANLNSY